MTTLGISLLLISPERLKLAEVSCAFSSLAMQTAGIEVS